VERVIFLIPPRKHTLDSMRLAARRAVRFASSRSGNAVAAASTSEAEVVLDVLVDALGPQSEASSAAARVSMPLPFAPRPTVASFGSVEELVTLSGEEKDAGVEEDEGADQDDLGELDLGDLEGLDVEGDAAPQEDYVAELLKGRNFTPQEVRSVFASACAGGAPGRSTRASSRFRSLFPARRAAAADSPPPPPAPRDPPPPRSHTATDRQGARPPHRGAGRRKARGGDCAAQPVAPHARQR
jgi:hypothetical protein